MVDSIYTSHCKYKSKQNLIRSFKTAFAGIVHTLSSQRNMKIHLLSALVVTLFGSLMHFDLATRAILLFCIALVFFAELINTAFESFIDLKTSEYHHLAKIGKDAAAGGVLILALTTALIFTEIIWVHLETIQAQLSQLMPGFCIGGVIVLSEALGVFFKTYQRWLNFCRYLSSMLLLIFLSPHVKDPIFCLVAAILINLSAYMSLHNLKTNND